MAREKDKKGKAYRPIKNSNMIGAGEKKTIPQIIEKGEHTVQNRIAEIRANKENPTPTTPTPQIKAEVSKTEVPKVQQPQQSQPQQGQQKSVAQNMSDKLKAVVKEQPKPTAENKTAEPAKNVSVAKKMSEQLKNPPSAQPKQKPTEKAATKEVKKEVKKTPTIKR